MAKEYAKVSERLQKQGSTPREPVSFESSTGIPIEFVNRSFSKYAEEHLNFERTIGDSCFKTLLTLKSDIARKIKSFKADTDTLIRFVTKSRAATIDMISLHEKVKARRVSSGSGNDKSFVDPWLTERVLDKHLRRMFAIENEFQEQMVAVLKDFQAFDEKVVCSLKYAVADFATARQQQHVNQNLLLEQTSNFVTAIESSHPFDLFTTATNLFHSATWFTKHALDSFPYTIQQIDIEKQATLSRPYFWSRSGWTPALFVVTESGYLHCFKQVHGKAKGDEARRRALMQHNAGFNGVKGLAAVPPNAEILEKENQESPVYNDLDAPSTFFSICLNNSGRISVNVVPDKIHQFVFAVDVFKTPRDHKTFKRFEIKATTESEMIVWVALLQEKIELSSSFFFALSFLPENPPQPLFTASHEILERLQNPIRRQPPPVPASETKEAIVSKSECDFTDIEEEMAVESRQPIAMPTHPQGVGEITGRTFMTGSTVKRPAGARKAPEIMLA
ncbi:hypothetical protein HDU98_004239 [Podochytrium sp. JEL0797]|nr:hypothetical protein HDU98_004239 [Podochytrium sp. JEL0797]